MVSNLFKNRTLPPFEWFAYVHEQGHMIHNSMYNFGNAASYVYRTSHETFVKVHEINRKEVTYLNDPRTPCQLKPREEAMNNCIQNYIENKMVCQLPWNTKDTTLPKCIKREQYKRFLDEYDEIASLSGFSIAQQTGCLPSCKINEFSLNVMSQMTLPEESGYAQGSAYIGMFYYPSGRYMQKSYYYMYDFTSYIADVGGLVGLFLGYSMLSFYDGLQYVWKNKIMSKKMQI